MDFERIDSLDAEQIDSLYDEMNDEQKEAVYAHGFFFRK